MHTQFKKLEGTLVRGVSWGLDSTAASAFSCVCIHVRLLPPKIVICYHVLSVSEWVLWSFVVVNSGHRQLLQQHDVTRQLYSNVKRPTMYVYSMMPERWALQLG